MEHRPIRPRFKHPVVAALETCADRRPPARAKTSGRRDEAERAATIVDDSAARIKARDPDAIEELCAHQALALDVIFDQCAREACDELGVHHEPMVLALRAQSHCRSTIKVLLQLRNRDAEKISPKRTIETENSFA